MTHSDICECSECLRLIRDALRADVSELGIRLDEANGARGIAEEEAKRLRAEVERLTAERDAIERRTIERCAEVCNDRADAAGYETESWAEALSCAAAIRAMKERQGK